MRSRYADEFNHDDQALGYDEDVRDESDPIRTGYSKLLDWVVEEASVSTNSAVLELGTGTGNLTQRLGRCRRLVCVDVSEEMLRIARAKLAETDKVEYVQADLLELVHSLKERFDVVVSTYAIHHLTEREKSILFHATARVLEPGGSAIFGDLMFADREHRKRYLAQLRQTNQAELADEIEGEFFWDLETALVELGEAGLRVASQRFSELSWGLSARARQSSW